MFDKRINKIKKQLVEDKVEGILVSSVSNITYLTGYANFSEKEREAYLLISKRDQFIITDGRYKEAILKEVPHFALLELSSENSLKNILEKLGQKINTLGIEEDNITISEHKNFKKHFKKLRHLNLHIPRSIKTEEELKKIEEACLIGDQTFNYISKKIRIGISEKELAWEIEKFIKDKGAEMSFPTIAAFGKNSSIPHHHTGESILGRVQIILLDFGVKFENYCSDMTRTVFFGTPSEKQKEIYREVLEAQRKAMDFINSQIKSGKEIKAAEVDKSARDYVISKGYPNIPHSLGHGVGLEVHESPHLSPRSKEILKPGMVFSIEPGIYIPDFGGVRIEDLYVIENNTLRQLTTSTKEIIKL